MAAFQQGTIHIKEKSATQSNADAGWLRVYAKTDGNLYRKDENGTEYRFIGDIESASISAGLDSRITVITALDTNQASQIAALSGANISQAAQIAAMSGATVSLSGYTLLATTYSASANALAQATTLAWAASANAYNNTLSLGAVINALDANQALQISAISGNALSLAGQIASLSGTYVPSSVFITVTAGFNSQIGTINTSVSNIVALDNNQASQISNISAAGILLLSNNINQDGQIAAISGANISQASQVAAISGTNISQAAQVAAISGTNISQAAQVAAISANYTTLVTTAATSAALTIKASYANISGSYSLTNADDNRALVAIATTVVSVPTGLTTGFGCSFRGTGVSFNGAASLVDARISGAALPWCALVNISANAYDVVGGKT